MNLATKDYMIGEPPPEVTGPMELGWPAVRKGLHSILFGYLLSVGMVLFAVALALYVVFMVMQAKKVAEFIDAALLIYAGISILFLMGLASLSFIIKGNICCLLNAPERCGARWLMFASTLCVVVGPALNVVAGFVGGSAPPAAAATTTTSNDAAAEVSAALRSYGESLKVLDGRAYVALTGNVANLLSGVFFVLFLRAVARCFNDLGRMRVAETYLIFSGVLAAVSVYFFLHPMQLLALPEVLLALGGGWLVAGLWYILLLVSTSTCIADGLDRRRSPLEI
jgi:hypothetical protein